MRGLFDEPRSWPPPQREDRFEVGDEVWWHKMEIWTMKNLLCRLGLHRWTGWSVALIAIKRHLHVTDRTRECRRCGLMEVGK